jgi:hypothetical protein
MMIARVVNTTDGRILLTQLKKPLAKKKTHCIEFHREEPSRDGKTYCASIRFMVLSRAELKELNAAIAELL